MEKQVTFLQSVEPNLRLKQPKITAKETGQLPRMGLVQTVQVYQKVEILSGQPVLSAPEAYWQIRLGPNLTGCVVRAEALVDGT